MNIKIIDWINERVKTVNGEAPDEAGNITPEQTGCLPLTGGTMTGGINLSSIARLGFTEKYAYLTATTKSAQDGAYIILNTSSSEGAFSVSARNSDGTVISLIGRTNGGLTWGGFSVEAVNTSGAEYIRYNNGLQICWGNIGADSRSGTVVTFPLAFYGQPMVQITLDYSGTGDFYDYYQWIGNRTSTNFIIYQKNNLSGVYYKQWLAIGYWR